MRNESRKILKYILISGLICLKIKYYCLREFDRMVILEECVGLFLLKFIYYNISKYDIIIIDFKLGVFTLYLYINKLIIKELCSNVLF